MPHNTRAMNQMILDSIQEMMYHHHPSLFGAQYRCEYCNEEPRSAHDNIHHKDNCRGVMLQTYFRNMMKE